MKKIRGELAFALALALARTAFCWYRAAHQSITFDEAYTYNRYLDSWHHIYWLYEANNHVLYSMLAKLSIQLFGLSELSLRLPSVIAGFFLVMGVFRVLQPSTSATTRWIAMIAISLHPLLLDFSVAARGYGLAVALLVWAVYCAMRRSYALAGIFAALSVSANLTLSVAGAGLMAAVMIVESGGFRERLTSLALMAAPFQAVLIAINFGVLRMATIQSFETGVGFARWQDSVHDLVQLSLHTVRRDGLFGGDRGVWIVVMFVLPSILILCITAYFVGNRQRNELIPGLTMLGAVIATVAVHTLFGLRYPEDRLGLFFILLFGITWAIAADRISNRWIRWTQFALAAFLVTQFLTQFETYAFALWKYDRESRAVAIRLKDATLSQPDGSLSVSTTWIHQPSMEFYRVALNIRALKPIAWPPRETELDGHDYYVLNLPDTQWIANHRIRVLFTDQRTGIMLGTSH